MRTQRCLHVGQEMIKNGNTRMTIRQYRPGTWKEDPIMMMQQEGTTTHRYLSSAKKLQVLGSKYDDNMRMLLIRLMP